MTNKQKNDQRRSRTANGSLAKEDIELIQELERQDRIAYKRKGQLNVFNVIWVVFLYLTITDFSWIWVVFLVALMPWWWMVTNWANKKKLAKKYAPLIKALDKYTDWNNGI